MIHVHSEPEDGFWVMENPHLRVRLHATRCWFDVEDKRTGAVWGHDPWYDTAGELTVRNVATQTSHVCHLSDAEETSVTPLAGEEKGFILRFARIVDNTPDRVHLDHVVLQCQLTLAEDRPELTARVVSFSDISEEWALQKVTFPCRFGWFRALDDAYLVVPVHTGLLFPGRGRYISDYDRQNTWADVRLSLDDGSINMPMFGVVREGAGLLAIVDTPFDYLLEVMANFNLGGRSLETTRVRLSACYPTWRPSHGALRYPRSIRYQFLPEADYVQLAKAYRADAVSQGKFRSLDDKAKETPALERLYGAPCLEFVALLTFKYAPERPPVVSGEVYDGLQEVEHSFEAVRHCLQTCHDELGIERAQVLCTGYGEGGVDCRYPDIFPINAASGGEGKFRELCEYVAQVGYVGPISDTTIHTYEDAPSFDTRNLVLQQGRLRRYTSRWSEEFSQGRSTRPLKQWAGGTEYTQCGPSMVRFAKRNYAELKEKGPISGVYLDVISAIALNECHDPNHPMARSDDAAWRNELFTYMRSIGLVVDSEMAKEYAVGTLDASHFWAPPPVGSYIPLWHLVYHDALITKHFVGPVMSYWGQATTDYSGNFLRSLVLGDSIMIQSRETWLDDPHYRRWLSSLCKVVRRLHGEVANQEMIDHRFLTKDHGVERSVFASGTQVTVNFRVVGFDLEDGSSLPPRGYHIRLQNNEVLTGDFWGF